MYRISFNRGSGTFYTFELSYGTRRVKMPRTRISIYMYNSLPNSPGWIQSAYVRILDSSGRVVMTLQKRTYGSADIASWANYAD